MVPYLKNSVFHLYRNRNHPQNLKKSIKNTVKYESGCNTYTITDV